MKKLFLTIILIFVLSLTGCAKNSLAFGKELVKSNTMTDILTELNAKTSDVGIMDSIMANYYINQDSSLSSKLMIIDDLVLAEEEYGVAARKEGKYTAAIISNTLASLAKDGSVTTIASKYGLTSEVCIDEDYNVDLNTITGKEDWDYIVNKGVVVIGYTVFAPMAYEENKTLIGFDIELAQATFAKLGLSVVFQIINWDTKEFELNSKNIDIIWNGLTINAERQENMSISIPYLNNRQIAVIRKEDASKYRTTSDMKSAIIAVESGSAAQDIVAGVDKK
ncbi:MAG TPA: transporter substrate-binding domain-containing protein [Bacilli bacterium]|jgi:polar amino acid transport system substrate-binding protein|nr:transporter substrate-binding domain-containing protein [Acholeplasmataceae bacterium]HNZ77935.1 transporter substrate-binding domain-containing protein [Bacilli bacterium]HOD61486.1 transporter substrate-binding domain-containing protein [Bacilli bacterium]HOH61464.1 transporter substrate-binding domain-containing protein [Bacilli bacterium]HPM14362.1 transporter substrate-binding domain-containing protein [Bacilli bacterium]